MRTIATGRVAQAAAKYGEHAPLATGCCNACRTCMTTNLVTIASAAVAAIGVGAARVARRVTR
jgi:hypothetical protein